MRAAMRAGVLRGGATWSRGMEGSNFVWPATALKRDCLGATAWGGAGTSGRGAGAGAGAGGEEERDCALAGLAWLYLQSERGSECSRGRGEEGGDNGTEKMAGERPQQHEMEWQTVTVRRMQRALLQGARNQPAFLQGLWTHILLLKSLSDAAAAQSVTIFQRASSVVAHEVCCRSWRARSGGRNSLPGCTAAGVCRA